MCVSSVIIWSVQVMLSGIVFMSITYFVEYIKKKTPFVLVSTGTYVGLHISPCAPVEFP